MTTVALFSGGMDSVAMDLLYRPSVLLHVDMGTGYGHVEAQRLNDYPRRVLRADLKLSEWERSDRIIPLRNLFLVAVAAQYGDGIMLGATAGDRVLDKSETFAGLASQLLSYLWSEQHWTPGRDIDVSLPLLDLTKRQIVERVWGARGHDGLVLLADSFSCYTPRKGKECGACKPCARKWVAFAAAGHGELLPYTARQYVLNGSMAARGAEDDDVVVALERT